MKYKYKRNWAFEQMVDVFFIDGMEMWEIILDKK